MAVVPLCPPQALGREQGSPRCPVCRTSPCCSLACHCLPEWDPPGVGGAELVTVAQPRVPGAGLGCSWLQPGLPAAVGAQSWYDWIPANDLSLLKATSGVVLTNDLVIAQGLASARSCGVQRAGWYSTVSGFMGGSSGQSLRPQASRSLCAGCALGTALARRLRLGSIACTWSSAGTLGCAAMVPVMSLIFGVLCSGLPLPPPGL